MNVTILDYGAGNLTSVVKALTAVGASPQISSAARDLERADALIVPGVGHFQATAAIDANGRRAVKAAIDRGAWVLGICLGLQWLFEGSDEAPGVEGLGIFPGRCFDLAAAGSIGAGLKVPHVGWNSLELTGQTSPMTDGLASGASVYFTHSYAAPLVDDAIAETEHGCRFTSLVARERIAGMQFHPEKSGRIGLRLLANFVAAAGRRSSC